MIFQAKCLWGTKLADLWLELNTDVLHYLSVAMKMPSDASEAADSQPAEDSAPASETAGEAGEAGEHVQRSPKKKRRRFQPKRSPKKKAKKTRESAETLGEDAVPEDANKASESEEEEG